MSLYLDRKFLLMNSARLRNFKQKNNDLFNFSCPFCGDSAKSTLKARGYIFKAKDFNGYAFKCWNCNVSTNMAHFLKFLDVGQYKEYIMETFQDTNKQKSAPVEAPAEEPTGLVNLRDITLSKISELSSDHYARAYVEARLIPKKYWDEIFFAPGYKEFLDEVWPNHGKQKLVEREPRLILFYTNLQGDITNVAGRSFGADAKLRYITVKVSDTRKVFGLHRVNLDRPIFVTEGQFDSMFLENAIASGDSSLHQMASYLYDTLGVKPTLVYDNEPRNKQIVQGIREAIKGGWKIVLWPDDFPGKDINDAVLGGLTLAALDETIKDNTFYGLTAELKLSSWRKC